MKASPRTITIAFLQRKLQQHLDEAIKISTTIAALTNLKERASEVDLLPAPEIKAKHGKASPSAVREFTVGMADIRFSAREAEAMDLFIAAPEGEGVSLDRLKTIFGSRSSVYRYVARIKAKLTPSGATITVVKGNGFLLAGLA